MKSRHPGVGGGVRSIQWAVGDLLHMNGKIWMVGLVTEVRMRLDPVSGFKTVVYDHEFESFGGSVNVSPNSVLDRASEDQLTQQQMRRYTKLVERGTTEERIMAETTAVEEVMPVAVKPVAAAAPVAAAPAAPAAAAGPKAVKVAPAAQPTVSGNKKANDDRLARIKEKKAAGGSDPAKANPVVAKEKVKRQCCCGCDAMVTGYFAQGHDARFKGWLLKIERGEMAVKDLVLRVQKAYTWVKSGDGMKPTKNYKGEAHIGYEKIAE